MIAAAAAAFSILLQLPFLRGAFRLDEPFFLDCARQILRDPAHPMRFTAYILWDLRTAAPADYLSLAPYYLAAVLRLAGGREALVRLACLPVDALAAAALGDLAAQFLEAPLLPALIVVACPGYFVNMSHLMPEKWMGAAGFAGLACLARGVRRGGDAWLAASAALVSAAIMCKLSGGLFLLAALAYAAAKIDARRLALFAAGAALPGLAFHAWGYWNGSWAPSGLWGELLAGAAAPWMGWNHRLRAALAGLGACGVVTCVWPFLGWRSSRDRARAAATALAAAAVLFLPLFDWTAVTAGERAAGVLLSTGALLTFWRLAAERAAIAGWDLWAPWAASAVGLELVVHGNVTTRVLLFALPPLILGSAALLERRWPAPRRRTAFAACLAATVALSLGLQEVDSRHADAQRDFAGLVAADYLARGRRVYFTGHWGFEHYLSAAGASPLVLSRGGWDQAGPGDVVVVPARNTTLLPARGRFPADVRTVDVDDSIPLRLIPSADVHAAFYTSAGGFLPYVFSREPVERFTVVEKR